MKTINAKPTKYSENTRKKGFELRRKNQLPFGFMAAVFCGSAAIGTLSSNAAVKETDQAKVIEFGETLSIRDFNGNTNPLHVVTVVRPYDYVELNIFDKEGKELKEYNFVADVTLPTSMRLSRLATQLQSEPRELSIWDYTCMLQPKFPKHLQRGLWVSQAGDLKINGADRSKVMTESSKIKSSSAQQVLGPMGCWVGYTLEPEARGASEKAHQLKGVVQGIRDEILADHFGGGE